jgi:hypothetical protein
LGHVRFPAVRIADGHLAVDVDFDEFYDLPEGLPERASEVLCSLVRLLSSWVSRREYSQDVECLATHLVQQRICTLLINGLKAGEDRAIWKRRREW